MFSGALRSGFAALVVAYPLASGLASGPSALEQARSAQKRAAMYYDVELEMEIIPGFQPTAINDKGMTIGIPRPSSRTVADSLLARLPGGQLLEIAEENQGTHGLTNKGEVIVRSKVNEPRKQYAAWTPESGIQDPWQAIEIQRHEYLHWVTPNGKALIENHRPLWFVWQDLRTGRRSGRLEPLPGHTVLELLGVTKEGTVLAISRQDRRTRGVLLLWRDGKVLNLGTSGIAFRGLPEPSQPRNARHAYTLGENGAVYFSALWAVKWMDGSGPVNVILAPMGYERPRVVHVTAEGDVFAEVRPRGKRWVELWVHRKGEWYPLTALTGLAPNSEFGIVGSNSKGEFIGSFVDQRGNSFGYVGRLVDRR